MAPRSPRPAESVTTLIARGAGEVVTLVRRNDAGETDAAPDNRGSETTSVVQAPVLGAGPHVGPECSPVHDSQDWRFLPKNQPTAEERLDPIYETFLVLKERARQQGPYSGDQLAVAATTPMEERTGFASSGSWGREAAKARSRT